jgi:hypothetical protein
LEHLSSLKDFKQSKQMNPSGFISRDIQKTSNLMGNSSLLNEKDISLNYSGIDDEANYQNESSNDIWGKHPLVPNKQYFTKENNTEFVSKETLNNKSFKKKKDSKEKMNKPKSQSKSLKKKKINKPPRLLKKPKVKKRMLPKEDLETSLNYSIE